jgi:hypothetical protein
VALKFISPAVPAVAPWTELKVKIRPGGTAQPVFLSLISLLDEDERTGLLALHNKMHSTIPIQSAAPIATSETAKATLGAASEQLETPRVIQRPVLCPTWPPRTDKDRDLDKLK